MDMVRAPGCAWSTSTHANSLGQYIEINPPLEQVRQMGMGVHQKWRMTSPSWAFRTSWR